MSVGMNRRADPATFKRDLPARAASALISVYRLGISPLIGPRCRFWPSCSEYGQQALARHGLIRGLWLTGARLVRCHPWNEGGVDPLPDRFEPPAVARYLGQVLRTGEPTRSTAQNAVRVCEPSRPMRADPPIPPSRP